MTEILPIKRALISVSDKTGLIEHAKALSELGATLVSTGGTHKTIADAGLRVADVSAVTGFPEMMDGRVKTLHPKVHGGLLALRDNAEHTKAMKEHGIEAFDVLYVNLYPFEATVARGADFETCIENIDIGGPAMIRAAAKNYGFIAVATDVEDIEAILAEAKEHGGTTLALVAAALGAYLQSTALRAEKRTRWLLNAAIPDRRDHVTVETLLDAGLRVAERTGLDPAAVEAIEARGTLFVEPGTYQFDDDDGTAALASTEAEPPPPRLSASRKLSTHRPSASWRVTPPRLSPARCAATRCGVSTSRRNA